MDNFPLTLWLVHSPDVNRLLFCFADSSYQWGHTVKVLIFSLKNREGLPPFKCLATVKTNAIYKSSVFGPSFGETPLLKIEGKRAKESLAYREAPYSPPIEVAHKDSVLAGTARFFSPDNYEVFYV